jgi:DNA-binding transcriptional LysR family regulator
VRLLNRTTRRLSLTEEGRKFHERSRLILADIDDAEQSISSSQAGARGRLRINAPVAFGRRQIVPLLPRFMSRYPQVEIDLELSDRIINMVEENVDVLLRVGVLSDSSLVARRLGVIWRVVCAAPSYLQQYGVPRHPLDLHEHNCLLANGRDAPERLVVSRPRRRARHSRQRQLLG